MKLVLSVLSAVCVALLCVALMRPSPVAAQTAAMWVTCAENPYDPENFYPHTPPGILPCADGYCRSGSCLESCKSEFDTTVDLTRELYQAAYDNECGNFIAAMVACGNDLMCKQTTRANYRAHLDQFDHDFNQSYLAAYDIYLNCANSCCYPCW